MKERQTIAEFKQEIGRKGMLMRLDYLFDCLTDTEFEIRDRRWRYQESLENGGNELERQIISAPIKELREELTRTWKKVERVMLALQGKSRAGITEDMIDRAREYPINQILECKRNMALCINHAERTPSMSVKNNRAHCFGCGWTGDAISVYQKLNNASFVEAVRALQ
ncbi:MAG: CHC2 zinc finger domain-containing protein [Nitrospirae bacterium]|nr:CHC2 zinc finger domain-containing protein [Nitrospirota bacterium]